MKTAIYPFSGDPITFGHIDIIFRSAKIFDQVIAAIGINPLKEYLFTLDERLEMARAALKDLTNVEVAGYTGLLADFAAEHNTNIIIRGIRNAEDFDYEWAINQINNSIDSSLETFWMPCRQDKADISSSLVKEYWQAQKDLSGMVPECVVGLLAKKDAYIN
jgi:pantetheine-phosphate adenylyltransferase